MRLPPLVCRLLVMAIACALAASVACSAQLPEELRARDVHVSLVAKDSVGSFLNRLAVLDGHVVATRKAVAGARERAKVREAIGVELHLVEGALPSSALRGERARIGGVAVVAITAGRDPHEWLGTDEYYVERVAEDEVDAPVAPGPAGSKPTPPERDKPRPDGGARADGGARPPAPTDGGATPAPPTGGDTPAVVDRVFLEARLRELSGAAQVDLGSGAVTLRERGSESGRALARTWLRKQYEALGFVVQEHAYAGGVNVIADKAGSDPSRFLLLTAHYDSVTNAGADDDGTGIVSALAIARALKDVRLVTGLRVVAFDQEELGLLGSKAYVAMLQQTQKLSQVVGVINLEMTGYDANDDGSYHVIDCGEGTSATLTARVDEALAAHGELRLTKAAACTNRSDHASFWRAGVRAIVVSEAFFSGDGNPCYHKACDEVTGVHWEYMRRVTQAVAFAAARIVSE